MSQKSQSPKTTRRKLVLTGAAVAATAAISAPAVVKAAKPRQFSLSEHLAIQGHLPRIRPGLCEEGE